MLVLFFVGPLAFLGSIVTLIMLPRKHSRRWIFESIVISWLLTYGLCVGEAFHNPVWYDNNVAETVEFPGQFGLALFTTAVYQWIVWPTIVLLYGLRASAQKCLFSKCVGDGIGDE